MLYELTDEQITLLKEAVKWYNSATGDQVFQYSAPAGAGKSFMMHRIIEACGLKEDEVAAMAYTGTAALVLRMNDFQNSGTIYHWLYTVEESKKIVDGKYITDLQFKWKGVPPDIKLICIDEGSMVPMHMREDILRCGVKVLVCGDLNQLPPIASGGPAFLTHKFGKVHYLTRIMRQAEGSSIVMISDMIKNGIYPKAGDYGDVIVIYANEVQDEHLLYADAVLCCRRKTKDYYNHYIRENLLNQHSTIPNYGEKVMCRYNNWDIASGNINLTNGLLCRVTSYPSISKMSKNRKFKMDVVPYMFPNTLFENVYCDYKYINSDIDTRDRMTNPSDPAYRKIKIFGNKFEYGYTSTIHASQGSAYNAGICFWEPFVKEEMFRLAYTGITRFRRFCILVLPYKKMTFSFNPFESDKGTVRRKKCVMTKHGRPII